MYIIYKIFAKIYVGKFLLYLYTLNHFCSNIRKHLSIHVNLYCLKSRFDKTCVTLKFDGLGIHEKSEHIIKHYPKSGKIRFKWLLIPIAWLNCNTYCFQTTILVSLYIVKHRTRWNISMAVSSMYVFTIQMFTVFFSL